MSSSGVVVPPGCSPRDCHATSKVALPEVSRVVVPEPVNSSPFHSVLALLTTGLGIGLSFAHGAARGPAAPELRRHRHPTTAPPRAHRRGAGSLEATLHPHRRRSMQTRTLGRTGRTVSAVGLGTWQLGADWGDVAEADALAVLDASAEAGVTFFDTADVYGDGRSESIVAQWRRANP